MPKKSYDHIVMIYRILQMMFVISVLVVPQVRAESFKEILDKPISVQKLIGTADSHVFAGWVGSLTLFPKKNLMIISELTSVGTRVRSSITLFDISRLAEFDNSLEIELIDSAGYDWRGRIWRDSDEDPLAVDIFRKDSPQRWAKMGKDGLKFLKDNHISHVILEQ